MLLKFMTKFSPAKKMLAVLPVLLSLSGWAAAETCPIAAENDANWQGNTYNDGVWQGQKSPNTKMPKGYQVEVVNPDPSSGVAGGFNCVYSLMPINPMDPSLPGVRLTRIEPVSPESVQVTGSAWVEQGAYKLLCRPASGAGTIFDEQVCGFQIVPQQTQLTVSPFGSKKP